MIGSGVLAGESLLLAGFSDGSGSAAANLELSQDRATQVLTALTAMMQGETQATLPALEAFGEALPMACDQTAAGRRLNRRVEVWALPAARPGNEP